MMNISRREFLRAGLITLSSLAFRPYFTRQDERQAGLVVRIASKKVDVYSDPEFESQIVGTRYLDQLVTVYYVINSPKGPAHNPRWYRVWGGYIHSNHTQIVKTQFNPITSKVPKEGQITELTVPFSRTYKYDSAMKIWEPGDPIYYETIHWITDAVLGPDGQPWYQITSEIDRYLKYYVPANHLRLVLDEEISPLSQDVDPDKKRIEINLEKQILTALENEQPVFSTRISSGIPTKEAAPKGMRTPEGLFRVTSKYPSKHMGAVNASGAPDYYSLPGVPWSIFIIYDIGLAMHGTFWHNNFGAPMSHGCINMRNQDAKWLFRWVTPLWEIPSIDRVRWYRTGGGTQVWVYMRKDTEFGRIK